MGEWFAQYWLEMVFGFIIAGLGVTVKTVKCYRKGLQALLRSQMINDYNHYKEKEFAPIYARENFENMWEQYHNLGANGVMDDIHEKFMSLPTTKEE